VQQTKGRYGQSAKELGMLSGPSINERKQKDRQLQRPLRNPNRRLRLSFPQAEVLDRGRQGLGFVGPAVASDFRRVLLKGVIVQDGAIGGRIVITANPKADEIPVLLAVPKPTPASDLIHIYTDLSRTRD
jgi:hypothetical protein